MAKLTLKAIEEILTDALYSVFTRKTERGWNVYEVQDADGNRVSYSLLRRDALEQAYQHYLDNQAPSDTAQDESSIVAIPDTLKEKREAIEAYHVAEKFGLSYVVSPDLRVLTTGYADTKILAVIAALLNKETAPILQANHDLHSENQSLLIRIAELEGVINNGRMAVLEGARIAKDKATKYSMGGDGERERYFSGIHEAYEWALIQFSQAKEQPAPVAEVTLTKDMINYLARTDCGDGYFTDFLPVLSPLRSAVTHSYTNGMYSFYRLAENYDTPANRAAIEARRKELGL